MGLRNAEEAICYLQSKIQDPNTLSSVLSRLLAVQDSEGSKLLLHAMYVTKSKLAQMVAPSVSAREPNNAQSQFGSVAKTNPAQNVPIPSSTRSDISTSNVGLRQFSHNPSHISNINGSLFMMKLIDEMNLLNKHLAMVNSPLESHMYAALKKSILCDMIWALNASYSQLQRFQPDLFKSKKEELLKSYQNAVSEYHSIQLPNGFILIPSSARKSLETYIKESRQFIDQNIEKVNNHDIQAKNMQYAKDGLREKANAPLTHPTGNLSQEQQIPVSGTEADHLSQAKKIDVVKSPPTGQRVHSSQPKPATIAHHQSHGLSKIQESNKHISHSPIIDGQRPTVKPALSQPMVAAQNEQTKASTVIVIEDEQVTEVPASSVSYSSLSEKWKICDSQSNEFQKKKKEIAFDEAHGSDPRIGGSLNTVNGDNRRIHLSKSDLSPYTMITIPSKEAVEVSPSSISGGVRSPSAVGDSQCDAPPKKQMIIVIDDPTVTEGSDDGEESDIHQRKSLPSREKSALTSPNRPNHGISHDLVVNRTMIKSRKIMSSDDANDGSFISEIRSLNNASSPSRHKKRKTLDSVDRTGAQNGQVDFNWQEGFVQGLFYNFGIESPFKQDQNMHVNQIYLDGFKAASRYYKRKIDEND